MGEQVSRPDPAGGSLPRTGGWIGATVFVGGSLLWIGPPLARLRRRREASKP